MKVFKLSLLFLMAAFFLMACGSSRTNETSYGNPADDVEEAASGESYWAKDNLDLQAVGPLLEKADDAEDFEYLLNSEDGVNNLDLNGDGYVDYLSVAEYDDRDDAQRGFTIFDRFGADEIQEIARIIFDRNRYNAPGARILLVGNEQIYGDNCYYETNWEDRNLTIADWVFRNRDDYYESPYYYENYPDDYTVYRVVQTPAYQTRIENYYYSPVFVKTVNPVVTEIKIKSRYKGKTADKIFAKLAKPTREQISFKKNNPKPSEFVRDKNERIKENFSGFENKKEKKQNKPEKFNRENNRKFENPNRPEKIERERNRPNKSNKPNKSEKPNKPEKVKRENTRPNKPEKIERQNVKPNKPNNSGKENGGGKTRGNGNGKGGGKKGKN